MSNERIQLIMQLASYLDFSKVVSKVGVELSNKQLRMILKALIKEATNGAKTNTKTSMQLQEQNNRN